MHATRDLLCPPTPGYVYGTYLAEVVDLIDPENQARIQVRILGADGVDDQDGPIWARLAVPAAGDNRGTYWIPDVGDEVLVSFANGDARQAIVIGSLWNGRDRPPESMDGNGDNHLKVLRSRNGVKITLDDQDGQEKLILETPGGQKMTLSDGPGKVEVIDSNGNSASFEAAGITVTAAAKVTVSAAQVNVSAGMVQVDTAMAQFSGMVKCESLIATSVIGTTYTPGAGNIW